MPGKRITRHLLILVVLGVALASGHAGDAKKPAKDSDGNALPDGALKRLGSLRWRHGESITFLALPADGKTLVTAGHDSVLRLWDRATGKEIRRFVPPADAMKDLRVTPYMQRLTRAAMSQDGKLLAVALPSNLVQLWDAESGKPLALRGVSDRTCFLHETDTGKEIRKLKPVPPGGKGGNVFGGPGDGTAL